MLRLIERSIDALEQEMVLLAPPQATLPRAFYNTPCDSDQHQQLLHEMQSLRGAIYLKEGNIKRSQLTPDGRHETPEDERSWHLLMTDKHGRVTGCLLYMEHESTVSMRDLRIRHCALAQDPYWGGRLQYAVKEEIARARKQGMRYTEVGGLAIEPGRRGSPDGLMLAIATYALGRMRGGALGITTANVAHACSSILRRLGGASLEFAGDTIPAYFDARYNTEIELLRFDSRSPSTKYGALIDVVRSKLSNVRVIADASGVSDDVCYETVDRVLQPVYAA